MPSGFSPSPRARPSPCRRPPSQAAAASHPALLCCSGAASQPCRSPQPLLLHRPLRRNHPSRSRRCRSGCPRCRFPLQRAPHRQPTPQLLRRQRSPPRCPLDPRARCPPRPARAADSSCASALVSSPARSTTQPAQGELGARRCTHTTPLMRSSVKVRARGSKTSSTSLLLLGRRFPRQTTCFPPPFLCSNCTRACCAGFAPEMTSWPSCDASLRMDAGLKSYRSAW